MSRDVFAATPGLRRFAYSALFAFGRIAPFTIARFIGYGCGLIFWVFDTKGKKIVAKNIQTLMPYIPLGTVQRMVRKNYSNFGISTFELLLIPRMKEKHFRTATILDPFKNITHTPIDSARILVTVHCNWEIMPCLLSRRGYFKQCHTVALSHDDPYIDALFSTIRKSLGVHSLLLDRAPLETLRVLKAGGMLALLGDRDYTNHGIEQRIGNGIMKLPAGPAALAIQTQAPILPLITCRSGASKFTVLIGKEIRPDPSLSKKEQMPIIMAQLAAIYERFLRSTPTQWACFHPIFLDASQDTDE